MKKQSVNTNASKLFLVSIITAALCMFSQNKVNATTGIKADSVKTEKAAVKYVGSSGEYLYFTVDFSNTAGKNFSLSIQNDGEDVLFYDVFNDKTFHKVFKLPKDYDISSLSFILKSAKENYRENFNVNISTKIIADVTVKRN